MKTFRTGFLVFVVIASGAMMNQRAHAAFEGEATYTAKLPVPIFLPDVRALIADVATERGWKVVDDRPGELTLELRHAKTHMVVVAKAYYTRSEFGFRKVSASTADCPPGPGCEVKQDVVQRWMLSLRREAGVALLRLAIKDAGASVASGREAIPETN